MRAATLQGFASILIWSMTVALVRSISEQLGPLTAAAGVYLTGGVLGILFVIKRGNWHALFQRKALPYLLGCGSLFVLYMLCFFLAVGGAADHAQVLEVGLLNYLWPVLTLIGTILFLGGKARWLLIPATLLALAGTVLILTPTLLHIMPLQRVFETPLIYLFAFLAALSWALYSVLARKLAGEIGQGAAAFFLCVTAVVLSFLAVFADEPRHWNNAAVGEMLFLGAATYVAYEFWDNAMRKGKMLTVISFSYLTPLFSTIFSCLYLAVMPSATLWIGCLLLVAGSVLSRYAILE